MDVERSRCFIHEILAPGFSPAPEGEAGTKGRDETLGGDRAIPAALQVPGECLRCAQCP